MKGKSGAALFATRTGTPLVPIYVSRKKYWFRPSPVVIGKPIYPKIAGRKATAEELEQITEHLMAEIYRLGEGWSEAASGQVGRLLLRCAPGSGAGQGKPRPPAAPV